VHLLLYFFSGFFFKYTVNVPINDDYDVLDKFNKMVSSDSIIEQIKLLFAQHNEHRIVYDRIWFLISYKINNQVNFNLLSLVGKFITFGNVFGLCETNFKL
jgi:hypothetical protein